MGFLDTPPSACFDSLLDFNIDETQTIEDVIKNPKSLRPLPLTECEEEEELEWLSNKDVFPSVDTFVPSVETFVDINTSIIALKHESPVSVLENSNSSFAPPIRRPRSRGFKRRMRGGFADIPSHQWFELCRSIQSKKPVNYSVKTSETSGRKCTHCRSEKTPQWRAGPEGPKTLCNACGVRFKSGRLCPEYRPANSPTFLCAVHSNSHRKIVEMRKTKNTSDMMINPTWS